MKKNSEKTDDTDGVKKDDEEQSQRFIEKAEEIGADATGSSFKDVFGSIAKKKAEPE